MAYQLIDLRVSPAGLALAAIASGVATLPALYAHQTLLAAFFIALYRLLSILSGRISKAMGHLDIRQRYLRPFMEIILVLSVMGGLSLYQPEKFFLPALVLLIVTLVFDLERRLTALLLEAQERVAKTGRVERLMDGVTGSPGRTILLIAACYEPTWFFWSAPGFAGICLTILVWRLISNYRQLGMHSRDWFFIEVETSEPGASSGADSQG
ncbi:hypothetical protein [Kushneria konosiri]|uniref:hypothetical protein n=1 Tax=Kushneria konosiri TaxID=698828 RepID=UPI0011E4CE62|nr:hypothetical protein [Kushneria konosiri]